MTANRVMGFKDAEWAYGLDRPLAETAVLAALCLRTDDATHETFVGQKTIAEMLGSSPSKVARALSSLEAAGVIRRHRRAGVNGYRTSDLITVNVGAYTAQDQQGDSPTGQNTNKANRTSLVGDLRTPTQQIAGAEEITQIDHPEDHSVSPAEVFERVWKDWPKRVEKKASLRAFTRAAASRPLDELEADVRRFGLAYARSVTEARFVPTLASWLRGERWTDDLPTPPLTRTEQNLAYVAQLEHDGRPLRHQFNHRCSSGDHLLLPDGTCVRCEHRPGDPLVLDPLGLDGRDF